MSAGFLVNGVQIAAAPFLAVGTAGTASGQSFSLTQEFGLANAGDVVIFTVTVPAVAAGASGTVATLVFKGFLITPL